MTEVEQILPSHGASRLPAVCVDAYNAEVRDANGFIGDRASKRAFQSILDEWRDRLRDAGEDPFGEQPSGEVGKRAMGKALDGGDVDAAGLVLSAVEEFANEFAAVCRKLFRLKAWRDTERIVVGGGFRGSRVGELAIGRAAVLLKTGSSSVGGHAVDVQLIRHDPDEAGLIGCFHLLPRWMLSGHDAMLGVDIGGTNMRAGLVAFSGKADTAADASILKSELWRHADDGPTRDQAVRRLAEMLSELIDHAASKGRQLAPFVGIGCPGLISPDGAIERGGQNLPGNWEDPDFHLPSQLQALLPKRGHDPFMVLMHNDAVVQGLSQVPWMRDISRWAILTIGTGLGNARFTNHAL